MLMNYVFMIPIRSKSTEEVIKAYMTGMYSTFWGSKYILSEIGREFTSKQFTFLANELGFIKVYTGNSIDWVTHFSKVISKKTLLQSSNRLGWSCSYHNYGIQCISTLFSRRCSILFNVWMRPLYANSI